MARAAVQRRLTWRLARVTRRIDETARAKTLVLEIPGWPGHRAGQHVDVRLTAPDGYQAERSYSIASAPEDGEQVALTVERIEDGEVSPYLVDELAEGDQLELRGPIGGYFVWSADMGGPLLLVAGGSGICPLMAGAFQSRGNSGSNSGHKTVVGAASRSPGGAEPAARSLAMTSTCPSPRSFDSARADGCQPTA
jgi:NAD(P)H-flavin reductase